MCHLVEVFMSQILDKRKYYKAVQYSLEFIWMKE